MSSKVSTNSLPTAEKPLALNYNYQYNFNAAKPYQLDNVGGKFFNYDSNGNVVEIATSPHSSGSSGTGAHPIGDGWGSQHAFAANRTTDNGQGDDSTYYQWDENNKLIKATVAGNTVTF
jgi:hypothetical protein